MTCPAEPIRPQRGPAVCFGAALLLFLITELRGLIGPRRGATFTELTRWTQARLPAPLRWVFRVLVLGLFSWAGEHLVEGLA